MQISKDASHIGSSASSWLAHEARRMPPSLLPAEDDLRALTDLGSAAAVAGLAAGPVRDAIFQKLGGAE